MSRTISPTSVSGRIRALLREGPIDTRTLAVRFGKPTAVMAALLGQLCHRNEARCLSRGRKGRHGAPAIWAAP